MTGRIQLLAPDISDKAVDHRGAIYSYIPKDAIVEFCYIVTNTGVTRGHHYHKEFDEYIMLVEGEGIYLELLADGTVRKIVIGPGQTIYLPRLTPHTFVPLTTCKSVSFLTKAWNDCAEPITGVDL
jgi:oxalate decarboxylase/phosphoglucose isomerase-like protein (cupin superfamily)